jgi:hypothetical protein
VAAEDIGIQVSDWVHDEISKVCFGEDYGWAVTWVPVPVQGPQGMVMIPAWQLVLTCQNPLLGQGDLYHLAQLGAPRPKRADVQKEVADGVRQLRELAKSKISGANGHAAAVVPG